MIDNVDLIGNVMTFLRPQDVNRLLRCSKSVARAVSSHEELFWSSTRLVKVFRDAARFDGKHRLHWIGPPCKFQRRLEKPIETFSLDPIFEAREILKTLWALRESRGEKPGSLFLSCRILPEFSTIAMKCYLFSKNMNVGHPGAWPLTCVRKTRGIVPVVTRCL
jgi:hypothetical protein